MITVIAADKAIQKALIWSSSVISPHTVLIILGPNTASHTAIPAPQISKIQSGIIAFPEIPQCITES